MAYSKLILFLLSISVLGCSNPQEAAENADLPIDQNATTETVALYNNLKEIAGDHVLYGHQDDLAYGYSWWAEEGRSDVLESTGSYPAVYGWDLGDLRQDAERNLDSLSFDKMKVWIKEAYERGGVNTISWHMNNPVTGGDSWDTTPAVSAIIPGGDEHETFKTWLDKFSDFVLDLRGDDGELIPIIFRPYHEHTGSWFWWGDEQTSVEDYVTLWRFTVDYLTEEKNVHNLLYAYSADGSPSRFQKYMEKYPGDSYVDILGVDDYGTFMSEEPDLEFLSNNLAWLVQKADEKNKMAALAETGLEALTRENWFTEELYEVLTMNPEAKGIAYVLTWRNANFDREQRDHFYAAHPDHPSASDMTEFRNKELILFEDELPNLYILE